MEFKFLLILLLTTISTELFAQWGDEQSQTERIYFGDIFSIEHTYQTKKYDYAEGTIKLKDQEGNLWIYDIPWSEFEQTKHDDPEGINYFHEQAMKNGVELGKLDFLPFSLRRLKVYDEESITKEIKLWIYEIHIYSYDNMVKLVAMSKSETYVKNIWNMFKGTVMLGNEKVQVYHPIPYEIIFEDK